MSGQAWERQKEEPARWFDRFCLYKNLGPERSFDAAYRAAAGSGSKGERAPGSWREAATKWNWQERAEKWDDWNREQQHRDKQELSDEQNRQVRTAWRVQLQTALEIISRAELKNLTPKDARRLLPTASRLLQGALALQGELPIDSDAPTRQWKFVFKAVEGGKIPEDVLKKANGQS